MHDAFRTQHERLRGAEERHENVPALALHAMKTNH